MAETRMQSFPPDELPWSDEQIEYFTRAAVASLWATRRAAGTKDIQESDEPDPVEDMIQAVEDDVEPEGAAVAETVAADDTRAGKHLDAFVNLLTEVASLAGFRPGTHIRSSTGVELPGYFRATKKWDLIVVSDSRLLAAVELKSMGGSYGKNFNNRTEEAMGSATDLREAIERGIIDGTPWLGYVYVIREEPASTKPRKSPFRAALEVDAAFQKTSYVDRYGMFCERLKESELYDEAAYLVSPRGVHAGDSQGLNETGAYTQPFPQVRMESFLRGLYKHLVSNQQG